ncbi:hypothetical protein JTB14_008889 [Gonioctena quinquepunctata]|nr:hypothetical protein JTB14_008889 [Gonioctena quinquepunctata]
MVNLSSRFIPDRSQVLEPLTALLKKNVNFTWDIFQQQSFEKVKKLLQNSPTLAYFDPSKQVSISADSSSYGLGACLIQTSEGKNEIVAYASRLLSDTEKRYAQIEREALALTWAADKFSEYITGILILLQTDHRPLIQVLQTKPIDELTPRLQRFRIRLMRYDYKIYYSPGKDLVVADALSRNFSADQAKPSENELASEVEAHVRLVVQSLQVKPLFLEEIKVEQAKDAILSKIKDFSHTGWPNKNNLCSELLKFYPYRNEISFSEGFLLRNLRIMIPPSLQLKCLNFIHQGHLGVVKCRERAKLSVWWIGLSTQIENLVRNCPQCVENRTNSKEPFFKDAFPNRRWQKIALDLFKSDSCPYFPQSNKCIEAAVKIAKNLIKKNDDIYLALLSYRTTPLECGLSPSELLYGRKLRTPLPVLPSRLNENINSNFSYTRKEGIAKDKSAKQFDKRHRTRKLSDLAIGDYVWVTDLRVYGKVIKILDEPRSYLIESINSGVYRRNRWHLVPAPYYSESTVTPRWAVPIDNNFKNAGILPVNREPQVNIGTENIEDTVRQDTNSDVCAPNVSQEEQQDI